MTLVNALKAAGLAAALKGAGPWTVFAPTDEAFAKLPRDTFDSLLQWENRDRLAALVRKHVVPGRVVTSAIAGQRLSIATVGDDNIYIDAVSGMTVDGAAVTRPDIEATNGIIHVIDRVILPQS